MEERQAGHLLREVVRLHAQVQRSQVAICCDTSSTQCHILTELHQTGTLTMAELVRRLSVDKGWVSRAVDSMGQDGLLTKAPNPADRRTILLSLTPAGWAKADEVHQTLEAQAGRVFLRIAPADRPAVRSALALLHEALRAELTADPILITLEEEPK